MSDPLRFFVPADSLVDDQVNITGDVFHHLRNVLRVNTGEEVTLLDGKGHCCKVEISAIYTDHITGQIVERWQVSESPLSLTLIQSLPKGDKFDLILQKGTELGVTSFQPVITEHTVPLFSASKLEKKERRWRRIVGEAARQSRRDFLPEIRPLKELKDIITQSTANLKLIFWEAGAVALTEALPECSPKSVELLIGPEGGFSSREVSAAVSAGFQAVHLGPRILRTETAGLAATPVLQYLYGDWQHEPDHDSPKQREERP